MTTAKFNRTAVQVPDAQAKIAARVTVGSIEKVHLESAHGRTLAETIQAPHAYPFFRRSGMNGFAIISTDTIVHRVIIKFGFESLMKFLADTPRITPLFQVRRLAS